MRSTAGARCADSARSSGSEKSSPCFRAHTSIVTLVKAVVVVAATLEPSTVREYEEEGSPVVSERST